MPQKQGAVNQKGQRERAVVAHNREGCSFSLGTYPRRGSAPPPGGEPKNLGVVNSFELKAKKGGGQL